MPTAISTGVAEAMPSGAGRSGHNLTAARELIRQAMESETGIAYADYEQPDHASRMRAAIYRVAEQDGMRDRINSTTRRARLYVQVL